MNRYEAIKEKRPLQNVNGRKLEIDFLSGNVSQEPSDIIVLHSALSDEWGMVWIKQNFYEYSVYVRLVKDSSIQL